MEHSIGSMQRVDYALSGRGVCVNNWICIVFTCGGNFVVWLVFMREMDAYMQRIRKWEGLFMMITLSPRVSFHFRDMMECLWQFEICAFPHTRWWTHQKSEITQDLEVKHWVCWSVSLCVRVLRGRESESYRKHLWHVFKGATVSPEIDKVVSSIVLWQMVQ